MPSLLQRWPATRDALNDRVARSAVGHWFRLEGCGHPLERPGSRFTTEIRAGLVTFASVVYIVALNPSIVSSTGGPCVAAPGVNRATDEAYQICVQEVRQEYIIVTAALSTLATGLIGIFANMPLALSTGLGVNSYFASIVGQYGVGGSVTYGQACGAVFVEGLLFFFLSLIGLRQWLARLMPRSLTISVSVAIGLFLALIGLGPAGLGVVGGDYIDLVGLGGCLPEFQDANGYCESHVLRSPKMWVGIFVGGIFTALLSIYRVRGAFLWPILLVAIISWPRSTPVTLFPHTATGDAAFDFFKQVARWTPLDKLGPQNIDWSGFGNGQVWIALITFLYVDALDTTGTMTAMSRAAGLYNEVAGDFEGSTPAFLADSGCISIGALMGSSPCTAFVESAAGIAEGGRTGITACTTAFCFFLTLFFAPIFSSIPSWATGSTLVIVGSLMAANARTINWDYAGDAIPAFVTIVLVPFTYNIAYGIIGGACTFIILHNVPKMLGRIHPSLLPPGHDTIKEPYSLGMTLSSGGNGLSGWRAFVPPWLRKALSGERHFWKQTDEEIRSTLEGRRITDARTQARASQAAREREEMRATMTQGPQEGGAFKDHDLEAGLRNVRSRNAPQQQSQAQHDEIEKLRDDEEPASPDASSKGE